MLVRKYQCTFNAYLRPQSYNKHSKIQRKSVKIFSFHAFCYYHEQVSDEFFSVFIYSRASSKS